MKIIQRNILLLLFAGIAIGGCKKNKDCHTCHVATATGDGQSPPPLTYFDTTVCGETAVGKYNSDNNHYAVVYSSSCRCNHYDIASCNCE